MKNNDNFAVVDKTFRELGCYDWETPIEYCIRICVNYTWKEISFTEDLAQSIYEKLGKLIKIKTE